MVSDAFLITVVPQFFCLAVPLAQLRKYCIPKAFRYVPEAEEGAAVSFAKLLYIACYSLALGMLYGRMIHDQA